MTVELGDQTIIGRAGDSLWIPRGTVHRFKVTSPVCRALNGYTPAGFEQVIIGLAKPTVRRELPPLMDPPDQITIDKVFNNYWCAEATAGRCPAWEYDECQVASAAAAAGRRRGRRCSPAPTR